MRYTLNLRHRAGFTFIELLVTTSLVGMIMLAISVSLNQGMKVWHRISRQILEEDLNIFFDRFSRDLRNSMRFSKISFAGASSKIRFATLVPSQSKTDALKLNIGEVVYSFDKDRKTIRYGRRNLSQIYKDDEIHNKVLLQGVRDLNFQYYFYDMQERQYLWVEEWQEENLPKAVRINLRLEADEQGMDFTRTISIPLSR